MQHSKLILLLYALKTEEHKSFGTFLQSTFFTKSEDVIRLWKLLLELKKKSKLNRSNKEVIFKDLFPKNEYSDVKLRNLFRKLTKIMEEFLIFQEHQNQPTDREILLNKIYRRRNVFSLFEKSGTKISKELEEKPERGSHYFLENYQWRKEHYFHPNTEKNSTSVLQLQDTFRHLHHFYSIEKLHIEVELRNQERIYAQQYDGGFFDTNIGHFAAPTLLKKVSKLISTQDIKIYQEVKTLFYEKLEELSEGDRNIIYPALLNFVIKQSSREEQKFAEEAFKLYQLGISQNILPVNGYISGSTFFNTSVLGSRLKKFEWVKIFIQKYQNLIDQSHGKDYVVLSKAYWNFHQNQFSETLNLLNDYEFNYPLLNINAKSLNCRTYFEISKKDFTYNELIINVLLSFKKFLHRENRVSDAKKENYFNFIFILNRILKYSSDPNRKRSEKNSIIKYIKNNMNVISRKWLLQKISQEVN